MKDKLLLMILGLSIVMLFILCNILKDIQNLKQTIIDFQDTFGMEQIPDNYTKPKKR